MGPREESFKPGNRNTAGYGHWANLCDRRDSLERDKVVQESVTIGYAVDTCSCALDPRVHRMMETKPKDAANQQWHHTGSAFGVHVMPFEELSCSIGSVRVVLPRSGARGVGRAKTPFARIASTH